jgi:hypothetical protein
MKSVRFQLTVRGTIRTGLELEATFARTIGERLDSAVVEEAIAIERNSRNAVRQCACGK